MKNKKILAAAVFLATASMSTNHSYADLGVTPETTPSLVPEVTDGVTTTGVEIPVSHVVPPVTTYVADIEDDEDVLDIDFDDSEVKIDDLKPAAEDETHAVITTEKPEDGAKKFDTALATEETVKPGVDIKPAVAEPVVETEPAVDIVYEEGDNSKPREITVMPEDIVALSNSIATNRGNIEQNTAVLDAALPGVSEKVAEVKAAAEKVKELEAKKPEILEAAKAAGEDNAAKVKAASIAAMKNFVAENKLTGKAEENVMKLAETKAVEVAGQHFKGFMERTEAEIDGQIASAKAEYAEKAQELQGLAAVQEKDFKAAMETKADVEAVSELGAVALSNAKTIDANTAAIETNAAGVTEAKDMAVANSHAIDANSGAIKDNAEEIKLNTTKINTVANALEGFVQTDVLRGQVHVVAPELAEKMEKLQSLADKTGAEDFETALQDPEVAAAFKEVQKLAPVQKQTFGKVVKQLNKQTDAIITANEKIAEVGEIALSNAKTIDANTAAIAKKADKAYVDTVGAHFDTKVTDLEKGLSAKADKLAVAVNTSAIKNKADKVYVNSALSNLGEQIDANAAAIATKADASAVAANTAAVAKNAKDIDDLDFKFSIIRGAAQAALENGKNIYAPAVDEGTRQIKAIKGRLDVNEEAIATKADASAVAANTEAISELGQVALSNAKTIDANTVAIETNAAGVAENAAVINVALPGVGEKLAELNAAKAELDKLEARKEKALAEGRENAKREIAKVTDAAREQMTRQADEIGLVGEARDNAINLAVEQSNAVGEKFFAGELAKAEAEIDGMIAPTKKAYEEKLQALAASLPVDAATFEKVTGEHGEAISELGQVALSNAKAIDANAEQIEANQDFVLDQVVDLSDRIDDNREALATKADASTVAANTAAIATKADATAVEANAAAIAKKADKAYVDTVGAHFDTKVTDLEKGLSDKADKLAVAVNTSAIKDKADKAYVNSALSNLGEQIDANAAGIDEAKDMAAVNSHAIDANSGAIVANAEAIAGKADAAAVAANTEAISELGQVALSNAKTIDANTAAIEGKADATTVASLENALAGKAEVSAVQANADSIRNMHAVIGNKADQTTVTAIASSVEGMKQDIAMAKNAANEISTIKAGMASKVDAATVAAQLAGKADVSAVLANAGAIDDMKMAVAAKANESAVTALAGTVAGMKDDIAIAKNAANEIDGIKTGLAIKAEQTAVDANTSAIAALDKKAKTSAKTIAEHTQAIAAKADASAVDRLAIALQGKADKSIHQEVEHVSNQLTDIKREVDRTQIIVDTMNDVIANDIVDAIDDNAFDIKMLKHNKLNVDKFEEVTKERNALVDEKLARHEGFADGIVENRKAIADAVKATEANAQAVAEAKDMAVVNSHAIDNNSAAIAVNAEGIAAAKDMAVVNSHAIDNNSAAIVANAEGIAAAQDMAVVNSHAIDNNSAAIVANAEVIATKADASVVATNTEAISEHAKTIATKADAATVDRLTIALQGKADKSIHQEVEHVSNQLTDVKREVERTQIIVDTMNDVIANDILDVIDDNATAIAANRNEINKVKVVTGSAIDELDALKGKVASDKKLIDKNSRDIFAVAKDVNAQGETVAAQGTKLDKTADRLEVAINKIATKANAEETETGIKANAKGVAVAQEMAVANSHAIDNNSAAIIANAEGIAAAQEMAVVNSHAIDNNSAAIVANAEGIAAAQEMAVVNSHAIDNNSAAIVANAEAIATKADAATVAKNTEAIAELGDVALSNAKAIDANAKDIAVNAKDITAAGEKISANTKAIEDNKLEISKKIGLDTFTEALAGKVDTEDFNEALATKADAEEIKALLATKADAEALSMLMPGDVAAKAEAVKAAKDSLNKLQAKKEELEKAAKKPRVRVRRSAPIFMARVAEPTTLEEINAAIAAAEADLATAEADLAAAKPVAKGEFDKVTGDNTKAIAAIQNEVATKANTADLDALAAKVDTKADASAVEALEAKVDTKADAADVEAKLADKANVSDLEAATTRLTTVEGVAKDNAERITKVDTLLQGVDLDAIEKISTEITTVTDRIEDNTGKIAANTAAIAGMDKKMNRQGAMSAALAGLQAQAFDGTSKTQILGGVGYYGGQSGVALGVAHVINDKVSVQSGVAFDSGSKMMANVGFSWKVGKGDCNAKMTCKDQENIAKENAELKSEIALLKAEFAQLKEHNAQVEAEKESMQEQIALLMKHAGLAK